MGTFCCIFWESAVFNFISYTEDTAWIFLVFLVSEVRDRNSSSPIISSTDYPFVVKPDTPENQTFIQQNLVQSFILNLLFGEPFKSHNLMANSSFYLLVVIWIFSSPVCWLMYGYYMEKLPVNHFWELED